MCNNPIAHPELTGGLPIARKGIDSPTLCGQHNEGTPTLEEVLAEFAGIDLARHTKVVGIPPGRVCSGCDHIAQRLN